MRRPTNANALQSGSAACATKDQVAMGQAKCRRQASERSGRWAEAVAALVLICRGYRILARRQRSRLGEIDLIAVRGRRLAFVEVKMRRSAKTATYAIGSEQARRIGAAAERWVWKRPHYRNHRIGLDSILVAPWQLPLYRADALQRA